MQQSTDAQPVTVSWLRGSLGRAGAGLVFAVLTAIVGVVLHKLDLPLVDTLDKHLGDLRIAYGSPVAQAQRSDIAIVLITEDTLLDYESRSPIDRALVAELVRAIDSAHPKAIGLDLILDRRTRHDAQLIRALREAKTPIVLGAIDSRIQGIHPSSLAIQTEIHQATGQPAGHVMLARKDGMLAANDRVVRYIAPPEILGNAAPSTRRAFVDVLAEVAGVTHVPPTRVISWERQPDWRTPLFPTISLPRHSPEAVKPALEGLFQPSWREFLKDRIVLVGAAMIDQDKHLTPLSALDGFPTSGIYIHAQALAQRIDGDRDIQSLPDWITALAAGVVTLACFVTARWVGFQPQSFLYGLAGLLLIGTASAIAFRFFRIDFPSIALAAAWVLGGFGGFVSDWVFRRIGIAA